MNEDGNETRPEEERERKYKNCEMKGKVKY